MFGFLYFSILLSSECFFHFLRFLPIHLEFVFFASVAGVNMYFVIVVFCGMLF